MTIERTGILGFCMIGKGVGSDTCVLVRVDISSVRSGFGDAVIHRHIPDTLSPFGAVMLITDKGRWIATINRMIAGCDRIGFC